MFNVLSGTIHSFSQINNSSVQFQEVNKSNDYHSRACIAPTNFGVEIDTVEYDQYQLNFSWEMDEPEPGWIHWDDGTNYTGIGCCPHLSVAARWDSGQLDDFNNYRISKMKIFINETYFDSLIFKIWEGGTEADLIYHDTIFDYEEDTWVEHDLISNLFLDSSKELWVGCSVRDMPAGTFTFGADAGPAVAGYGDLIREDWGGYDDWDTLSDLGLDYNWNIQCYVEDTAGNEMQVGKMPPSKNERNINLSGYNLFQSINGEEYELLEFIPWEPGDTTHSIVIDASPNQHCYQLTAVWLIGTDTCESAPALSKDNPEEDFVCVLLVGNEEDNIGQSGLVRCFPNPFSTSTTISYTLHNPASVQISIFNHLGKQVDFIQQNQLAGKQQISWDASGQPSGVYYFRFQASEQVTSGKMVLVH